MKPIVWRSAFAVAFLPALLAAFVSSPLLAGPGHDHGPAQSAPAGPSSPRIVATSENFEYVGILKAGVLTSYLDLTADTSPVTDAKIELFIGGESGAAIVQPDGTYLFESPGLNKEGTHEVIVSIEHGKKSDLLVGALTVPHDHEAHDHDAGDHSGHSAEGEKSAGETSLAPLLDALHWAGIPEDKLDPSAIGSIFLVAVGLTFGLLIGALVKNKSALSVGLIGLMGLVTLLGTGTAWAGPGHDHGHGGGAATAQNGDAPRRLPDGALFLPKPTQRLLDIRTRILALETTRSTQKLIGRVITDPNRSGLVQSTIGGRIAPAPKGLPSLGQQVKAGDILAYVEPAFAPIDASDVGQTAGDLDQRITLLDAKIQRQQRLVDRNVGSRASLEDLEIERDGLKTRRQQLLNSKSKREALLAPVDGVIAEVRVGAGQVVNSADTLFHIVDPTSLWVEAISYDPRLFVGDGKAKARTAQDTSFDLTFIGRSRTLRQQAVVLQFRIDSPSAELHIGSPVSVIIESGKPMTGLVIPRSAVAQAPNGQMIAFKKLAPERYKPEAVRFNELDAESVLITAGLKVGDQIIVRSAPLVNQIR